MNKTIIQVCFKDISLKPKIDKLSKKGYAKISGEYKSPNGSFHYYEFDYLQYAYNFFVSAKKHKELQVLQFVEEPQSTYKFNFTLGDLSGDGHERTEDFDVKVNLPLIYVLEAWDLAEKKFPKELHPTSFCNEYEENFIPEEVYNKLKKLGCPLSDKAYCLGSYEMAEIVVWFLNQGNPSLYAKLYAPKETENVTFGTIGYGLFTS